MKKMQDNQTDAAELRRRAEEQLKKKQRGQVGKGATPLSAEEPQRLIHELQVHKIELDMQNEELLQSRTELEAVLARYIDLYDFAPVGYFMLARDGAIHQANLTGAKMLGAERGALIKRRLGIFIPAQSRTTLNTFLEKVFGSRQKETCEVALQKDGFAALWVRIEAITEDEKECRAVVVDITEREQAEMALRESEEKFRAMFENMAAASCLDEVIYENGKAVDYRIIDVNPAFEKIIGVSKKDTVGQRASTLYGGGEIPFLDTYIKVAETGQPISFEAYFPPINKTLHITASCPEKGKFSTVFSDITERKLAEDKLKKKDEELREMTHQLWQAAKLATMGELAASIAHELNNPLATVSLRVESMLTEIPADNFHRRELEIIEKEIERMSNLIANLLQFSCRGQPQISTVNVCEEIEKTIELIYYHLRKHNISIIRQFVRDVPQIHADRQQLRQLFLNLFTNASDAMPQGGTLTIRVTAPPESRQVVIEVTDTGTGIPPEILPKVMEPFYTTKPEGKGTGLGLSICRRILQEYNGTFDLTSEGIPGKGTTASISLPVKNGENVAELK